MEAKKNNARFHWGKKSKTMHDAIGPENSNEQDGRKKGDSKVYHGIGNRENIPLEGSIELKRNV